MEFRTATQADFDYLAEHSISRGIQKYCPDQTVYVYALECEGIVLGIGGFRLINKTTAWCWIDLSTDAKDQILIVYRTMKEWGELFCREHGIVRLQCYVEKSFPEAIRMVTHFGFKEEFCMPNFVGSESAYMYSKFYGLPDDNENKQE